MRKFISQYENPFESKVNLGLINREYDEDLVHHIVDTCKSLSVVEYIEFLDYQHITSEKDIDLNNYIRTRKKGKKAQAQKFKQLHDSRYSELIFRFRLTCKGESEIIEKRMLIPATDELGYYTINGKRFFLIYQLVDSSTYAKGQSVILKSLMPVVVMRRTKELKDTDGNITSAYSYSVQIFSKAMEIMYFYFAKAGVEKTLQYFSIDSIVDFTEEEVDKETNYYFAISSKLLVEVNKEFFDKHEYVRNMVATILSVTTNRLTLDDLYNNVFWIERIGSINATKVFAYREKGENLLMLFDRMLDESTKKILKIHEVNKTDIYSVIRWLTQNFDELRKKDDIDLNNKRLRANEYIASLLTKEFSKRVNRIISYGNKVNLDVVKDIFKFPGDVILTKLHSSGLGF